MTPPRIDARLKTIQQQFDARAARFGRHDAVVREVGRRMLERLQIMQPTPGLVLDLGCGSGACRAALEARFPQGRWLGVDLSPRMLTATAQRNSWQQRWRALCGAKRESWRVGASAEQLPLAARSVAIVFSNLMLHWHPAPHAAIAEAARVLTPGGLLLFSSYGPDTARELRDACAATLPSVRPLLGVDMHDYGDMLTAAGFQAPVMEVETLQLLYPHARALLAEVRALGGNPRAERAPGLPSSRQAHGLLQELARRAAPGGPISLSVEVVIGHGWRAGPGIKQGKPAKQMQSITWRPRSA